MVTGPEDQGRLPPDWTHHLPGLDGCGRAEEFAFGGRPHGCAVAHVLLHLLVLLLMLWAESERRSETRLRPGGAV